MYIDYEDKDSNELMVNTECSKYDMINPEERICVYAKITRYCPWRDSKKVKCDGKGILNMTSLYYPLYRVKNKKKG